MNPATRRRLATSISLFLLAISTLLAGYRSVGPAGPGAAAPEPEPLVAFTVEECRVDDALQLLADRHGVRVLVDERMPERVSCTFKQVKLSEALLALAGPDRYSVVRDGKIYRVVPRLAPSPSAGSSAAPAVNSAAAAPTAPPPAVAAAPAAKQTTAASSAKPSPAAGTLVADDEALEFLDAMIDAGRHAEAEPILRELLKKHPRDARVHALLGNVHRGMKRLVSARASWRRATELDPANAAAKNGAIQADKVIDQIKAERRRTTDPTLIAALDAYLM